MKYLIAILLLSSQLVFAQNIESERQGVIGVRYTRNADGMIVIKYVEDKSPAAQAGIQVNDIMISVDGSTLKSMDPANIKNVLRGKVGSTAEIKLENPQTKSEYAVSVIRRVVQFGASDAPKDSTKNNPQAEIKNVDKTEISPKVAPLKPASNQLIKLQHHQTHRQQQLHLHQHKFLLTLAQRNPLQAPPVTQNTLFKLALFLPKKLQMIRWQHLIKKGIPALLILQI